MAKSMLMAYCMWFVGGWYGLHHFYLRRDRQALIWWMTGGGCFGLGNFRDLWRIPDYVNASNNDGYYIAVLKTRIQRHTSPPFSTVRFSGELVVGWLLGVLIYSALPDDLLAGYIYPGLMPYIRYLVVPFGIAIGAHLVANVGHEQVSLKACLTGAYTLSPLFWLSGNNFNHLVVACAVYVNWKGKEWRLQGLAPGKPVKKNVCRRIMVLLFCGVLYSGLWAGVLYHNAYVTTSDGEPVPLKDALHNFFTSPAWSDTKDTLRNLWNLLKEDGFSRSWQEFNASLDPEGETNAYKVLGLANGANEEEVKTRYKKLVRRWHPDTVKDPARKDEAEKKFMQIQKAYETLSHIKARRTVKSHKSRPNPEQDRTHL